MPSFAMNPVHINPHRQNLSDLYSLIDQIKRKLSIIHYDLSPIDNYTRNCSLLDSLRRSALLIYNEPVLRIRLATNIENLLSSTASINTILQSLVVGHSEYRSFIECISTGPAFFRRLQFASGMFLQLEDSNQALAAQLEAVRVEVQLQSAQRQRVIEGFEGILQF